MQLGERFAAAGFELYLVGGSVRDAFLGESRVEDFDFTTQTAITHTAGSRTDRGLSRVRWER